MKRYRKLAEEIRNIYQESHSTFSAFQDISGLTCLTGCGSCCYKSQEIYATPLEMLPMAIDLIDQNSHLTYIKMLEDRLVDENQLCVFFDGVDPDKFKGRCTKHELRPCVCRSFGAAVVKNKLGTKELSVCKLIKKEHAIEYENAKQLIDHAPVIGTFASRVNSLDFELSRQSMPINHAMLFMLKKLHQIMDFEEQAGELC